MHGHGTHVTGTMVSDNFGYFHNVVVHAVKVLSDSGYGSYIGIMEALNWTIGNCVSKGRTCVINMSLGGGRYEPMNDVVNKCVQNGIHTVVAAGNSNSDAKDFSPASASEVITVGAST